MKAHQGNKKPDIFTRSICFALSAVFFITNVVGAQAPKSNNDFWSERQKAVKAAQEYAQLPGQFAIPQWPASNKIAPNILPDIAGIEAKAKQQSAVNIPHSIAKNGHGWLRSLPYNYGTLEEFYVSNKKDSPVIVFIQDVHGHYEAQLNIANIINNIAEAQGTEVRNLKTDGRSRFSVVIGLEGAVGAFDFSPYKAFPDKEINKEIADYFLKSGLISGPEYTGLIGQENVTFWGVENKDTYLANIEAFKEALPLRGNAKKQIGTAVRRLVDSKRKVYSPEMLALDDKIESYHSGTLGLGEYLEYLTGHNVVAQFIAGGEALASFRGRRSPSPLRGEGWGEGENSKTPDKSGNYNTQNLDFPNVRLFLETFKLEKTINFQKVEDERRILIEKLVNVLNKKELENLVYQAVAHRMGNIDNGAYYHELENICQKHGLKLSNWPELARYVRYSIGADRIDRRALFKEINQLEEDVVFAVIATPQVGMRGKQSQVATDREIATADLSQPRNDITAMDVYDTSKTLSLISKLVDNNLTDEEWNTYKELGVRSSEFGVQKLETFEKFYEVATSRNKILIENLLSANSTLTSTCRTSVLIAGGFHTQSMAKLLKEKQISYAVLSPKLTEVDTTKGTQYLEAFAHDRTPLDKLMLGEKIFLAVPSNMGTQNVLDLSGTQVHNSLWIALKAARKTMGLSHNEAVQIFQNLTELVKENKLPAIEAIEFGKRYISRVGSQVLPIWINGNGFTIEIAENKLTKTKDVEIQGEIGAYPFTIRKPNLRERITSGNLIPFSEKRKLTTISKTLRTAAAWTLVTGGEVDAFHKYLGKHHFLADSSVTLSYFSIGAALLTLLVSPGLVEAFDVTGSNPVSPYLSLPGAAIIFVTIIIIYSIWSGRVSPARAPSLARSVTLGILLTLLSSILAPFVKATPIETTPVELSSSYTELTGQTLLQPPKQALTIPASRVFPKMHPRVTYPMIDDGPRQAAPVGGLGTGSWSRNLDGQMTRFHFSAAPVDEVLPEGQINIWQRGKSKSVIATPLGKLPENDKRLSAWNWTKANQMANSAIYHGLYPYSWWEYPASDDMPARVTVKQYSPFIPENMEITSLPVAVSEVIFENPTNAEVEAAVMMSMPNFSGWGLAAEPIGTPREQYFRFEKTGKGQYHLVQQDKDYIGIVMGAERPKKDIRLDGQLALVTEKQKNAQITYHTAFDVEGNGASVWQPFAKNGELSNTDLPTTDSKEQASAVAVRVRLAPGERRVVPFVFAWDIPYDVRNEKTFNKHYTRRYGASGTNAYTMATQALKERTAWTNKINQWQSTILNDSRLPEHLKTMLINELYFLTDGGSLFTDDGRIFYLEGWDYRIHSTIDVWFYTSMFAHYFPELEKTYMREFARLVSKADNYTVRYMNPFPSRYGGKPEYDEALRKGVKFDPNHIYPGPLKLKGAVPHHLDDFVLGPVSGKDDNDFRREINRRWQNHNAWKDLNPKFVLMVYRAYVMDGRKDNAFIREVWPAVKDALDYLKTMDLDNDGHPDHGKFPDQTYDTWTMEGTSPYSGTLTLAALRAAQEMAKIVGDKTVSQTYEQWFQQGRETLFKETWNGKYFNIYEGNTDIMSDQLVGQWYADLLGLPSFIEEDKIRSVLRTIYENNFKKFANGNVGIVNGMSADGRTLGEVRGDIQADEAWIGTNFAVISMMLMHGMEQEAWEILETLYKNIWLNGYQYRTPEGIDADHNFRASMYMRAGAVYTIYQALEKNRQDVSPTAQMQVGARKIAAPSAHAIIVGKDVRLYISPYGDANAVIEKTTEGHERVTLSRSRAAGMPEVYFASINYALSQDMDVTNAQMFIQLKANRDGVKVDLRRLGSEIAIKDMLVLTKGFTTVVVDFKKLTVRLFREDGSEENVEISDRRYHWDKRYDGFDMEFGNKPQDGIGTNTIDDVVTIEKVWFEGAKPVDEHISKAHPKQSKASLISRAAKWFVVSAATLFIFVAADVSNNSAQANITPKKIATIESTGQDVLPLSLRNGLDNLQNELASVRNSPFARLSTEGVLGNVFDSEIARLIEQRDSIDPTDLQNRFDIFMLNAQINEWELVRVQHTGHPSAGNVAQDNIIVARDIADYIRQFRKEYDEQFRQQLNQQNPTRALSTQADMLQLEWISSALNNLLPYLGSPQTARGNEAFQIFNDLISTPGYFSWSGTVTDLPMLIDLYKRGDTFGTDVHLWKDLVADIYELHGDTERAAQLRSLEVYDEADPGSPISEDDINSIRYKMTLATFARLLREGKVEEAEALYRRAKEQGLLRINSEDDPENRTEITREEAFESVRAAMGNLIQARTAVPSTDMDALLAFREQFRRGMIDGIPLSSIATENVWRHVNRFFALSQRTIRGLYTPNADAMLDWMKTWYAYQVYRQYLDSGKKKISVPLYPHSSTFIKAFTWGRTGFAFEGHSGRLVRLFVDTAGELSSGAAYWHEQTQRIVSQSKRHNLKALVTPSATILIVLGLGALSTTWANVPGVMESAVKTTGFEAIVASLVIGYLGYRAVKAHIPRWRSSIAVILLTTTITSNIGLPLVKPVNFFSNLFGQRPLITSVQSQAEAAEVSDHAVKALPIIKGLNATALEQPKIHKNLLVVVKRIENELRTSQKLHTDYLESVNAIIAHLKKDLPRAVPEEILSQFSLEERDDAEITLANLHIILDSLEAIAKAQTAEQELQELAESAPAPKAEPEPAPVPVKPVAPTTPESKMPKRPVQPPVTEKPVVKTPVKPSEPKQPEGKVAEHTETAAVPVDTKQFVEKIARSILNIRDSRTKLPPSHPGHPGYEDVYFLYDLAHNAIELKLAGHQKEVEELLDYVVARLRIPKSEVEARKNVHGIYGIRMLWEKTFPGWKLVVDGVLNALNIRSTVREGRGILEFLTTPGPMSWLGIAMLQVNRTKYLPYAIQIGEGVLKMQDPDGGIRDGNRSPTRIHVEPHMDGYGLFNMLAVATHESKWQKAADRAWRWFETKALDKNRGVIVQGIWDGRPNRIHATDVYTWPIAMSTDRLDLATIKKLITTVERLSLVKVTFTKPDNKIVTVILPDFTNPEDPVVMQQPKNNLDGEHRGGYHPMGTTEWAGGFALMYQAAAIKAWQEGDREAAIDYKAKAEALLYYMGLTFHEFQGALYAPYATGQWIATGHGWRTNVWQRLGDGSTASAWFIIPAKGYNVLVYDGANLAAILEKIPSLPLKDKLERLNGVVFHPPFTQPGQKNIPEEAFYIWEPGWFLTKAGPNGDGAWGAFVRGEHGDKTGFRVAVKWANKVVELWSELAAQENQLKAGEFGGLIQEVWGQPDDVEGTPIHAAIWKYPLLNEIGAAAWILAAANFELGNTAEAKKWVRFIVERIPLHQIHDPAQHGYWNAEKGWNRALRGMQGQPRRDYAMAEQLYVPVLRQLGRTPQMPREVPATGFGQPVPAQETRRPGAPATPAISGNLLARGNYGQYESYEWKSKAIWWDFDPPIELKGGQKYLINYTLTGSDVMGIQLIPEGTSENDKGDMMVVKGVSKKNTIEIEIPSDRRAWRIAFQIGENAWGKLGGSLSANLTVHSIVPVPESKVTVPRSEIPSAPRPRVSPTPTPVPPAPERVPAPERPKAPAGSQAWNGTYTINPQWPMTAYNRHSLSTVGIPRGTTALTIKIKNVRKGTKIVVQILDARVRDGMEANLAPPMTLLGPGIIQVPMYNFPNVDHASADVVVIHSGKEYWGKRINNQNEPVLVEYMAWTAQRSSLNRTGEIVSQSDRKNINTPIVEVIHREFGGPTLLERAHTALSPVIKPLGILALGLSVSGFGGDFSWGLVALVTSGFAGVLIGLAVLQRKPLLVTGIVLTLSGLLAGASWAGSSNRFNQTARQTQELFYEPVDVASSESQTPAPLSAGIAGMQERLSNIRGGSGSQLPGPALRREFDLELTGLYERRDSLDPNDPDPQNRFDRFMLNAQIQEWEMERARNVQRATGLPSEDRDRADIIFARNIVTHAQQFMKEFENQFNEALNNQGSPTDIIGRFDRNTLESEWASAALQTLLPYLDSPQTPTGQEAFQIFKDVIDNTTILYNLPILMDIYGRETFFGQEYHNWREFVANIYELHGDTEEAQNLRSTPIYDEASLYSPLSKYNIDENRYEFALAKYARLLREGKLQEAEAVYRHIWHLGFLTSDPETKLTREQAFESIKAVNGRLIQPENFFKSLSVTPMDALFTFREEMRRGTIDGIPLTKIAKEEVWSAINKLFSLSSHNIRGLSSPSTEALLDWMKTWYAYRVYRQYLDSGKRQITTPPYVFSSSFIKAFTQDRSGFGAEFNDGRLVKLFIDPTGEIGEGADWWRDKIQATQSQPEKQSKSGNASWIKRLTITIVFLAITTVGSNVLAATSEALVQTASGVELQWWFANLTDMTVSNGIFLTTVVAAIFLDQAIKIFVRHSYPSLVKMANIPPSLQVTYRIIYPIVLTTTIVYALTAGLVTFLGNTIGHSMVVGFALLSGGTLSNVWESSIRGHVTDWIPLRLRVIDRWNIADVFNALGALLTAVGLLWQVTFWQPTKPEQPLLTLPTIRLQKLQTSSLSIGNGVKKLVQEASKMSGNGSDSRIVKVQTVTEHEPHVYITIFHGSAASRFYMSYLQGKFKDGAVLIHFDKHSDMGDKTLTRTRPATIQEAEQLDHNIMTWIPPMVYDGLVSEIWWVIPGKEYFPSRGQDWTKEWHKLFYAATVELPDGRSVYYFRPMRPQDNPDWNYAKGYKVIGLKPIMVHRVKVDNLPDMHEETQDKLISYDEDYAWSAEHHPAIKTREEVVYRIEKTVEHDANVLAKKGIIPNVLAISLSPEYVPSELMESITLQVLNRFNFIGKPQVITIRDRGISSTDMIEKLIKEMFGGRDALKENGLNVPDFNFLEDLDVRETLHRNKLILSALILLGWSLGKTVLGLTSFALANDGTAFGQNMQIFNLLAAGIVSIGLGLAVVGAGWLLWNRYRPTVVGQTASPARAPTWGRVSATFLLIFQLVSSLVSPVKAVAYSARAVQQSSILRTQQIQTNNFAKTTPVFSQQPVNESVNKAEVPLQQGGISDRGDKLVQGIVNHMAAGTSTGMSRSHIGMGGWLGKTGFLYDLAHNIIEADLDGTPESKKFAEKTLDYLAQRLDIPIETVRANADDNGVWGILQIFRPLNSEKDVIGILNGININNTSRQGEATEWWTTPGPVSWLISAMLHVNPDKYLHGAEKLAQTLIAMRNGNGGIVDGTRSDNYFTEPTIDVYSAMTLLYDLTGKDIYKETATNILNWLYNGGVNGNGVIDEDSGVIYLGIDGNGERIQTHATDFYTWTIATLGLEQGLFSADLIKKFIKRLEQKSLVYINYTRPDKKKIKGLLMADFTDPGDEEIKDARGGYHPTGTVEWLAGMILMYQVAAVRFSQEDDDAGAQEMKAKAEILLEDAWKTFYPYQDALLGTYALTSWLATFTNGWFTPIQQQIGDASSSVGWLEFPEQVFNPFFNTENNNNFRELYLSISPPTAKYKAKVRKDLIKLVTKYHPVYTETGSYSFPLNPDAADKPRFYEAVQGESSLDAYDNYFLEATYDGSTVQGSAAIDLRLRPGIKKGMNIEFWIRKIDSNNPAKSIKIFLKSEHAGWEFPIYSKSIPVTETWKHVKIKLDKKIIAELQKNAPDKKDVHIVQVGFEIGSAQTGNPSGSTVKIGAINITNGKVAVPPIPEPVEVKTMSWLGPSVTKHVSAKKSPKRRFSAPSLWHVPRQSRVEPLSEQPSAPTEPELQPLQHEFDESTLLKRPRGKLPSLHSLLGVLTALAILGWTSLSWANGISNTAEQTMNILNLLPASGMIAVAAVAVAVVGWLIWHSHRLTKVGQTASLARSPAWGRVTVASLLILVVVGSIIGLPGFELAFSAVQEAIVSVPNHITAHGDFNSALLALVSMGLASLIVGMADFGGMFGSKPSKEEAKHRKLYESNSRLQQASYENPIQIVFWLAQQHRDDAELGKYEIRYLVDVLKTVGKIPKEYMSSRSDNIERVIIVLAETADHISLFEDEIKNEIRQTWERSNEDRRQVFLDDRIDVISFVMWASPASSLYALFNKFPIDSDIISEFIMSLYGNELVAELKSSAPERLSSGQQIDTVAGDDTTGLSDINELWEDKSVYKDHTTQTYKVININKASGYYSELRSKLSNAKGAEEEKAIRIKIAGLLWTIIQEAIKVAYRMGLIEYENKYFNQLITLSRDIYFYLKTGIAGKSLSIYDEKHNELEKQILFHNIIPETVVERWVRENLPEAVPNQTNMGKLAHQTVKSPAVSTEQPTAKSSIPSEAKLPIAEVVSLTVESQHNGVTLEDFLANNEFKKIDRNKTAIHIDTTEIHISLKKVTVRTGQIITLTPTLQKGEGTIFRVWIVPIIASSGLVGAIIKLLTTPNAMALGGIVNQPGIAGIALHGIFGVALLLTTAIIIMQVHRLSHGFMSPPGFRRSKELDSLLQPAGITNIGKDRNGGEGKFRGLLEHIFPIHRRISEVIDNWKTPENGVLKRTIKLRTAKNAFLVATLAWTMGATNVTGNYDSKLTKSPETFISAANFLDKEELPKGKELKEMEKKIGAIIDQIGEELRQLKKAAKSFDEELETTGVEHGFKAEIAKMKGHSLKRTLKKQTRKLGNRLNAKPASREIIESRLQVYGEATMRGRWLATAVKRGDVQTKGNVVKEKDVQQLGAQMRVLDVTRLLESDGQLGMNYTVTKLREYKKILDNLSETERSNIGLQLVSRVEGIDSDAEVKKRVQDILAVKKVGADLIQLVESADVSLYKTMKASGLIKPVELQSSKNGAKTYVNQIDSVAFAYKWFKHGIKVLIAAEDPRGWTPIDDEQMDGLVEILLFVIKDHEIDVSRTIRNYYSIERAVDIGA